MKTNTRKLEIGPTKDFTNRLRNVVEFENLEKLGAINTSYDFTISGFAS
jgi:hypothetical protein